jgi:hypothetical protein
MTEIPRHFRQRWSERTPYSQDDDRMLEQTID